MQIPETIYIETTNLCNAECIMCPHRKMKRPQQTMTDACFHSILEGLHAYDLSHTQLFLHKEGEPLCDPQLEERITVARSQTIPKVVGINTNAMLLTPARCARLLSSGLDTIYFSIDGTSTATYNRIRVNCDYDTVAQHVRTFLELRAKSHERVRVIMQMLLDGTNDDEKETFLRLWSPYDVEFYIKPMHCYLDGGKSSFAPHTSDVQLRPCKDPFRMIVVYSNGHTGACCWDYDNEYDLGMVEGTDLIQIYQGPRMEAMRFHQAALDCKDMIPCNRCGRIFGDDKIRLPDGDFY